jgi:hypothetical protein
VFAPCRFPHSHPRAILHSVSISAFISPPIPISVPFIFFVLNAHAAGILQRCGLCLRPAGMCELYYKASRGASAVRQVDWKRSKCDRPMIFNMASASVSKDAASPCSNFPVQCSLCDANDPLVWTYHLAPHYQDRHNRSAVPFTYRNKQTAHVEYEVSPLETRRMEAKWNSRFKFAQPRNTSKKKTKIPLLISAAHRSSLALR